MSENFNKNSGYSNKIFVKPKIIDLLNKNIILKVIEPIVKASLYIEEREKVWEEMSKKHGDNLWNGEVYTLESCALNRSGEICLTLSWCEYKDIIYKKKIDSDSIRNRFGDSHVSKHLFTTVVAKSLDGKLLFGKKGQATFEDQGLIDLIGESLNKNEMTIKTIEDIAIFTKKELKEETGLVINDHKMELIKLCSYNDSSHFFYTCKLPINSKDIKSLPTNKELEKLIFLNPTDILIYNGEKSAEYLFHSQNTDYGELYRSSIQIN